MCQRRERAHKPVRKSARVEDLWALLYICRNGSSGGGGGSGDGDDDDEREKERETKHREVAHLPPRAVYVCVCICTSARAMFLYLKNIYALGVHTWPSILLPVQTPQLTR